MKWTPKSRPICSEFKVDRKSVFDRGLLSEVVNYLPAINNNCNAPSGHRKELSTPILTRDGETPYRCSLYGFLRGDSQMVQALATEMYARGLSTRDIEDAFTDDQGRCLLSRSKVSEVTEVLWQEYRTFQDRDLSSRSRAPRGKQKLVLLPGFVPEILQALAYRDRQVLALPDTHTTASI